MTHIFDNPVFPKERGIYSPPSPVTFMGGPPCRAGDRIHAGCMGLYTVNRCEFRDGKWYALVRDNVYLGLNRSMTIIAHRIPPSRGYGPGAAGAASHALVSSLSLGLLGMGVLIYSMRRRKV